MTSPTGHSMPHGLHGVVDLAALARPAHDAASTTPPPGSAIVLDVTEAEFADVVQRSAEVPVLIVLWAADDPASAALAARLSELTEQLAGRLLLARVDVRQAPQVAQAVGSQTGSTVAAVIRGQALPLPPLDRATPDQLRSVLDQVLQTAESSGVTGRVAAPETPDEPEPEAEPPLPPLHQQAFDAIEADDLDSAVDAYTAALAQDPRDELARAGLAQVTLLRRVRSVDAVQARAAAATAPDDVAAQLTAADLDVVAGAVEDAFDRLLDVVRSTSGPDRERARAHLVDLFTVVGDDDARVAAARRALASALY